MKLSEFILANREPILKEWEAFARSCKPASGTMDIEALRDHADEMLSAIAADLATSQSSEEQTKKSKGHANDSDTAEETAAEEHGGVRAESGFSVEQMVAEFRALRASVIRLWTEENGELRPADIGDLTRFNEAIDQALAESVTRYNRNLDQAKEIFLAILGHDLRTPLGAIYTSASFLVETQHLAEPALTLTARIARSANRTVGMVGDLLDFTRARLGGGIPIDRQPLPIGKLVHEVVDEICAAHPDRKFEIQTRREGDGEWDRERLSQALSNLISNAVQHGDKTAAIHVEVVGGDRDIRISIHNQGTPIPKNRLDGIFNPMKPRNKIVEPAMGGPQGSLGLGLFIAQQIVQAHKGSIEVVSTAELGTKFTVCLPRHG
ncbi:MAG: sensor histidine kinase [Gemmatimonadetes bacterium]|nr:sensor histidine kinase [Gemmatimonadota bacterium]